MEKSRKQVQALDASIEKVINCITSLGSSYTTSLLHMQAKIALSVKTRKVYIHCTIRQCHLLSK